MSAFNSSNKKITKAEFPKIPRPSSPTEIPPQQPSPGTHLPDITLNAVSSARSSMEALRTGGLHPAMDYSLYQSAPSLNGVVEDDETVANKAKYRQEFPF